MAGVQIDGVNNKIDFDDDLDTSISANTDDTLVIEAGGNTMATITATTFTINDGTTITTADNTDTLSLVSTDADANIGPNLRFYRNSGSPADSDQLGNVIFKGRNDNSEDVNYAQFVSQIKDASDGTEDARFAIFTMVAGSEISRFEALPAETVFNENSVDLDFRVESNGATHMLFVDGGNDRIYVGAGSGSSIGSNKFQVQNGGATISSFANDSGSNQLHFVKSRNTTVGSRTIVNDGDSVGGIFWKADDGDATDYNNNVAGIEAVIDGTPGTNDTPGRLVFYTTNDGERTNTERMRISSTGKVGINLANTGTAMLKIGIPNAQYGLETKPEVNQTYYAAIFRNSSGNDVGRIESTASATSFVTSSDYRLKENVSYDFDATTRLKQLKPSRFNFINTPDTTVDGFLAHEVSSIVPEAISGTKDATETKEKVVVDANGQVIVEGITEAEWTAGKVADEDGNTQYPSNSTWEASKVVPVYQGIDQSKLVPLLVKTIQELEARITTLEG